MTRGQLGRDFEEETGYEFHPWKWLFAFIGFIILIGVIAGAVNFVGSWGNKAAEVVGPANVEKQYQKVIDDWESLYATSENACLAKAQTDENSPTFVESVEQAYAATFRKVVVDYNRRQANLFEAKIAGPLGYPQEIPRSLGSDGDWCSVPETLDSLMD